MVYLLQGGVNFESSWPHKKTSFNVSVNRFKQLRWPIFKTANGLKEMVKSLEKVSDDHEYYSWRNCLLIHGIDEDRDEVTDDIVLNILQDKLELEISKKDIDRSYRIGKPSPRKKRPIIVKFVWYNDRHKAYSNEKD